MDLRWEFQSLQKLTAADWHAVLAVRQAVFVVEQQCAYQDADAYDLQAWHLRGLVGDQVAAYARLLAPGAKYAEASIGRVLTAPAWRGQGLGHGLMAQAMVCVQQRWPGSGVRISAQAHLQAFYRQQGFVADGAVYDEDGIAHIDMVCPAPTTT